MNNRNDVAPWEQEHMQEQEREAWLAKLATRTLLTKGQWYHGYNRRVIVQNAEARKARTTMNGRTLYLFSEEQTVTVEQ